MRTIQEYINESSRIRGKRLDIIDYEKILKRGRATVYDRSDYDSLYELDYNRNHHELVFWFMPARDPDDGDPVEADFKLNREEEKIIEPLYKDKRKWQEFNDYAVNWDGWH